MKTVTQLKLATFNKDSVEDFQKALVSISNDDMDFNGENGDKYLWEESFGFGSNQEYMIDMVKDLNYKDGIALFLEYWLGSDDYYYSYDYKVIENNNIVSIALAYTY